MLSKLNEWLTLLGNFGVLAGIVFLIIEVQQNTESLDDSRRLAEAQAYQQRSDDTISMMIGFAESDLPDITAQLNEYGWPEDREALNKISRPERYEYLYLMNARWNNLDNVHYNYQQGFIDEEFYNSAFVNLVRSFGASWESARRPGPSRPSFIAEVERILYGQ